MILRTSNNFIIVRLPMQSSEQKLLQFDWLAPDFDPKMCLARAIPKEGTGFTVSCQMAVLWKRGWWWYGEAQRVLSWMVPRCLIWECIFQCLLRRFTQVELLVGPWDLLFHWMIWKQLYCEAMRVAELLVLWSHVLVCTVLMLGSIQVFHRGDIGSKCRYW